MSKSPRESRLHCRRHGMTLSQTFVHYADGEPCNSDEFYVQTFQLIERPEAARWLALGPNAEDVIRTGVVVTSHGSYELVKEWAEWAQRWLNGDNVWYFSGPDEESRERGLQCLERLGCGRLGNPRSPLADAVVRKDEARTQRTDRVRAPA